MDRKTYGIGILIISAVLLGIAQFIPVRTAEASVAVKDRDYSVVTTRTNVGGDALYVIDNRTGMVAVFQWNPATRRIEPRDVKPVSAAFE